jgi:hypothetical protein
LTKKNKAKIDDNQGKMHNNIDANWEYLDYEMMAVPEKSELT